MVISKITNRTVKLKYGNGCPLNGNCFTCKELDCLCGKRQLLKSKDIIVDINTVWGKSNLK
jgi:hypothetical protein